MSLVWIRYIFIAIGIIYFLFPRDLLPDFLGLVGRIDDLLLLGFLYWKYKRLAAKMGEGSSGGREAEKQSEESRPFDPYEVLELSRTASTEAIETRYRELARLYHPDKVNHLGPELKKLAHEKMVAINKAYGMLKGR